ncbi:tyrosine-type recombinase/integrase [Candidatus Falkowbacteria bacterium]|nr:tyrosine-type recombinase/integrase [Candidatus Falkowbacteria bacterium]
MASIKQLTNEFIVYLEKDKQRSGRTTLNYNFYLRRFCAWAEKNKIEKMDNFSQSSIARYGEWLKKVYNPGRRVYLKKNSQRSHLIALRMFCKFLSAKKGLRFDYQQIKLPPVVRPKFDGLDKARLEMMLTAPRSAERSKLLAMRDAAILELLHDSGLKVSEISHLRKNDLNLLKNIIRVKSKHGWREILVGNQARYALAQYLQARKDKLDFVFIGHDRTFFRRARQGAVRGLTPRSVERIVQGRALAARAEAPITPERLRRNYISRLIKKGESANNIKKRMGFVSDNYKSRFVLRTH